MKKDTIRKMIIVIDVVAAIIYGLRLIAGDFEVDSPLITIILSSAIVLYSTRK
ncbi:MAG: hypothetical protein V8Q75_01565 [Bacilli bacterium]